MIKLYPHQQRELDETSQFHKVAYYHDMGLGKTFTGAEKMMRLGAKTNLVICQKSKVDDWVEHFKTYYDIEVLDLTKLKTKDWCDLADIFLEENVKFVMIINYELAFRREELSRAQDFTLMLDESSLIQNETSKRSKFILNKLHPENVILLSGTPVSGKYEKIWSQMKLLGWNISKQLFWKQFVEYRIFENNGFPIKIVTGYKNTERLKVKMREYGCRFLKTEEVFDMPKQTFTKISVNTTKEYRKFKKQRIVEIDDIEFVGDTTLTKMLYERMLCGSYNSAKIQAFCDLVGSTNDRLIVFYNFEHELKILEDMMYSDDFRRPVSIVNGFEKDLKCYEECENSVTFIQYQAGAMGLNLQKANKIIYFTPTLNCDLWMQSKKRIHRIGQSKPCMYYMLVCKNSVEEKIYEALERGVSYTDRLFEGEEL